MNVDDYMNRINKRKNIDDEIFQYKNLLDSKSYLTGSEVKNIEEKINHLEIIKKQFDIQSNQNKNYYEKNQNFFYTLEEIENADEIKWLISNMIPKQSIGLIIGASGVGKTTAVMHCCEQILTSTDAYIVYLDGDMSLNKIKEIGAATLMNRFEDRFKYAGKNTDNFSNSAQDLIKDIALEQKKYQDRTYLVIEDSLTLTARKKRGFIDTESLYKNEKLLREFGGSALIIHHTNKIGVFADSQQIENFADYTYEIKRSDYNSCVLLHPKKVSRFDIVGKAFKTHNKKIIEEVSYEDSNLQNSEVEFIKAVIEILEESEELNQSELISNLEEINFLRDYKLGQKKAIKWLKRFSKGRWSYEKRPIEKNAVFYCLEKTEKVEKLAKHNLKGEK